MSSIPFDLKKIRGFAFDMDGVLSATVVPMMSAGEPSRTLNIKDGYALQYAVKQGFVVAIISGGDCPAMVDRARYLGIPYVYMRVRDKVACFSELLAETGLTAEQFIYVGDDLPDIPVMTRVGLPVAPNDAASDVKAVAGYISPYEGGRGVVREVIEQTLKTHGCWGGVEGFGW